MILIPKPLLAAGSKLSGNTSPSFDTDNHATLIDINSVGCEDVLMVDISALSQSARLRRAERPDVIAVDPSSNPGQMYIGVDEVLVHFCTLTRVRRSLLTWREHQESRLDMGLLMKNKI